MGTKTEEVAYCIGITAMHMQLLKNDRAVIFDRTDFGMSNLSLPNGECQKKKILRDREKPAREAGLVVVQSE
jgi:hypothetical protein